MDRDREIKHSKACAFQLPKPTHIVTHTPTLPLSTHIVKIIFVISYLSFEKDVVFLFWRVEQMRIKSKKKKNHHLTISSCSSYHPTLFFPPYTVPHNPYHTRALKNASISKKKKKKKQVWSTDIDKQRAPPLPFARPTCFLCCFE